MARGRATAGCLLLVLACATPLGAPPKDRSGAWGYVQLAPREGVTPGGEGESAYADRRLRDVRFVDYSRPGFAVVYAAAGPSPGGRAAIAIRSGGLEPRLDPVYAAVGAGGAIRVDNATRDAHVLSAPGVGLIRRLAPGEGVEIPVARAGEEVLFLLDAPRPRATVFVAPGPFAVVSASGRFEIADLAPGRGRLAVWHPRFPPSERSVVLHPCRAERVDFELSVEQIGAEGEDGGTR